MAKGKDPAFLFYPADASEDTQFMNRLERGCYFDLLKAQKKFRRFTLPLIQKVLGADFTACWPAIESVLRKDGEVYMIGWADDAMERRANWSDKSSNAGIRSARLKEARKKGTHTNKEWLYLLAEANGICPRCNEPTPRFAKDHVVPIYQGGSDGINNIQPLCPHCNGSKGPEDIDFFKDQRESALLKLNSLNQSSTKGQPKVNQRSTLDKIENAIENENADKQKLKEYDDWTQQIIDGNDHHFEQLFMREGIPPGEHIQFWIMDHRDLLNRYPKMRPPTQDAFRKSCLKHIRENHKKPINGTAKKSGKETPADLAKGFAERRMRDAAGG